MQRIKYMKELSTASGKPVSKVGLGTFPLQGEAIASNIEQAISLGYNLIDTADDYRGETGIGITDCRRIQQLFHHSFTGVLIFLLEFENIMW